MTHDEALKLIREETMPTHATHAARCFLEGYEQGVRDSARIAKEESEHDVMMSGDGCLCSDTIILSLLDTKEKKA